MIDPKRLNHNAYIQYNNRFEIGSLHSIVVQFLGDFKN